MSTCRNLDGRRVIVGRHDSTCGAPESCRGCLPCTEAHCLVCRREHAAVTCPACVGRTRADLAAVVAMSDDLAAQARMGPGAFKVREVPGGDALVLAGPGADPEGAAAQLAHRVAFGLDTSHTSDERRVDPRPVVAVLAAWAERGAVTLGLTRDEPVAEALDHEARWLNDHLSALAGHVMFAGLASALAFTVRQLEDVLHDGERPDLSRVPCLECGTRLEKRYGASTAHDSWVCPACRETYDAGRYERAKHDQLASTGAERYVFVPDAASVIGRSVRTVRSWVERDQVASMRDESGRLVVWWPDVRARDRAANERIARRKESRS